MPDDDEDGQPRNLHEEDVGKIEVKSSVLNMFLEFRFLGTNLEF